jgi:hypothetical protein
MRSFYIPLIITIVILLTSCVEDSTHYPLHQNITVTIFWVGEDGNEENNYIPNLQSVWDDKWLEHYGGVDDPNNRNGYFPTNFTPFENPFYYALPYNDFDENGERKAEVDQVIYWSGEQGWGELESMCKNRWIKIIKGNKSVYAQWEDAGPFGDDDADYVFGDALPKNELNNDAGLDVSPAVRDFLSLSDIDVVNWRFVDFSEVPAGPWTEIITTSQIYWE